ncbi:MAG: hypothetical protein BAA01_15950 [Bacillus thermozeamaize]|uniref:Spore coat protein n=1 Tax=Bacillus thermozeamaize TaxID=230954 RepID=A0A1Y3PYR4_9BACI|nr:MAG: hypothetical protein BAA01_15950 [Bacillus thermozeamaize]
MHGLIAEKLRGLNNQMVRVNRGGSDSHYGRLITVNDDHLVLMTDDQEIYCQTHHVKSIATDSFSSACSRDRVESQAPSSQHEMTFRDVLNKMMYRRVQINGGGPENIGGVLVHLHDQDVVIVDDHEVIFVPIFHIKTIRCDLNKVAEAPNNISDSEKGSEETGGAMTELAEGEAITSAAGSPAGAKAETEQTRYHSEYYNKISEKVKKMNHFSKRTVVRIQSKRKYLGYRSSRGKTKQRSIVWRSRTYQTGHSKTGYPMVWIAPGIYGNAKGPERRWAM